MDLKRIKELIDLVEATGISGLAVEEGDTKIEIRKQPEGMVYAAAPQQVSSAPAKKEGEAKLGAEHHGLTAVKSPMTGTFYTSSSPDAPAYVQVGSTIGKGQPVCIIEAMKTFNIIESEVSGTIEKILIKNQQPVEFGQVLMLVRE